MSLALLQGVTCLRETSQFKFGLSVLAKTCYFRPLTPAGKPVARWLPPAYAALLFNCYLKDNTLNCTLAVTVSDMLLRIKRRLHTGPVKSQVALQRYFKQRY